MKTAHLRRAFLMTALVLSPWLAESSARAG
jgi:hypothetical protein